MDPAQDAILDLEAMEAEPSTVLGCVRETTDLTLRLRPRQFHGASPTARLGRCLFRLLTSTRSAFRDCWMCRLNRTEPPYADPHVRWCGRGGEVTLPLCRFDRADQDFLLSQCC